RQQLRGVPRRREGPKQVGIGELLPKRASILPGGIRRQPGGGLRRDPRWHSLFGNGRMGRNDEGKRHVEGRQLCREYPRSRRQEDGHGQRLTVRKGSPRRGELPFPFTL